MKKTRNIFWGIFFIVAAILIVLSTFSLLPTMPLFTLIATILIVAVMIESLLHINFTGILFSLAFLGILYSDALNISKLTPWPILVVALLGSIGLSIIFGSHRHNDDCFNNFKTVKNCDDDEIKEEMNQTSDDEGIIDIKTNMGASIKYINTDDFKVANINCSFGGVKVYFDKAIIKGNSARINIYASFSGIELYIPKEWKIVNNLSSVLAAVDEKNNIIRNKMNSQNEKNVVIEGTSKLSGIEIIYI
jgi:hypothetical protein